MWAGQKQLTIATSNTALRRRRTSITSTAGRNCISAGIASLSSAIRLNALYFLNSDVQRAVIDQDRKDNIIPTYIKDSSLSVVDVEVKEVVLDDLRQSPYSARIESVKIFTNPTDHSELKRERSTARVTYVFRENVKNNELAVDPLGLTIVRFRADQAFS